MRRFTAGRGAHKVNCWEFTDCGREPGGNRADDLGVCPAAADRRFDGVNGGINGGRACWVIAGTCGHGPPEGILANTFRPCTKCEFYRLVQSSATTVSDAELIERLRIPLTQDYFCMDKI